MSWQAWAFLVIAVIAVILLVVSLGAKFFGGDEAKDAGGFGVGVSAAVFGVGVVLLLTGVFTTVGTRQIGLQTSFGRPTGTVYDNGLHWKAPWTNVSEMDGAIQYNKYAQDANGNGNAVKVRLGNNTIADADVTIRWELQPKAVPELFVQYKTFDNIRTNLIERNLQVALNEQFQSFDPLSTKWSEGVPLQTFANAAADKLRSIVGTQVTVYDISITKLDYDQGTEEKLNTLNTERVNTAVALQQVKTVEAQSQAATARAEQQVKTAEADRQASVIRSQQPPPNVLAGITDCIRNLSEAHVDPSGCWGQIGVAPVFTLPAR